MTDNEIIKALECCADEYIHSCDYCPFEKECCGDNLNLVKFALDLINRLQAEKEALIAGQETLQKALAEKNAEIERLNKATEKDFETIAISTVDRHQKYIKRRAIKEFADRLKGEAYTNNYCEKIVLENDIDNLVKEMVGDTE